MKVEVPNLKDYIGRSVKVVGDDHKERVVEIEHLVGSLAYPHKLQINGKYLISMLDFFGQMMGEKFSDEHIRLFNETVFDIRPTMKTKVGGLFLPTKKPNIVPWRGKKR